MTEKDLNAHLVEARERKKAASLFERSALHGNGEKIVLYGDKARSLSTLVFAFRFALHSC